MRSYVKAEIRNAESIKAMKRRTPGLKLLLFLLAGAIINVGVAWGFALTVAPALASTDDKAIDHDNGWGMFRYASVGTTYFLSLRGEVFEDNFYDVPNTLISPRSFRAAWCCDQSHV